MAEYMARPIISAAARTRLSTLNLWLIFMMNRYLIFTRAFDPEEVKRFDLSFTYSYGDGKVEALPTAFIANTVSPIPEPETYAMLLAGLGLLGWRMHHVRG